MYDDTDGLDVARGIVVALGIEALAVLLFFIAFRFV